jgi:hypothetical protein
MRVETIVPVCSGRFFREFAASRLDPGIDQCYPRGEPEGSANFPPALTMAT